MPLCSVRHEVPRAEKFDLRRLRQCCALIAMRPHFAEEPAKQPARFHFSETATETFMSHRLLSTALICGVLAIPTVASAQGVINGTERGAREGGHAAGPVGAVVGGVVGGVAGGVAGVLGVDERPRFREYVVRRHVPSYRYREAVRVGTVLPADGVTYYEVPEEYGVTEYRYTVVNDHPVLVEPRTRRVVEVID
jgi:hypothetical protein